MSNAPIKRRTQAERTKISREKIIHEATRLFAEGGYRGTKLADIAAAVGMTEPGLLHHFPNKALLLASVLEERDHLDLERYAETIEGKRNIMDSARELVEHNESVPGLVQLFTVMVAESITTDHPAHSYFVGRYQSIRSTMTDLIRSGQENGGIRKDFSAEELAVMFMAMMDGLQVQWLIEPESVRMSRVFNRFLDLIRPPEK